MFSVAISTMQGLWFMQKDKIKVVRSLADLKQAMADALCNLGEPNIDGETQPQRYLTKEQSVEHVRP